MTEDVAADLHSISASDDLGYQAQAALAAALPEGEEYRLVGGHMVRLLLEVYPASLAVRRSTADADAALDDVAVVGHVAQRLIDADFEKAAANLFVKAMGQDQWLEINLLLARDDHRPGLQTRRVSGIGYVDTLPELRFALHSPALLVRVSARLTGGQLLQYEVKVPTPEVAVVLKAHSWAGRRSEKDLEDLRSLLEIRAAHPTIHWELDRAQLRGRRLDTARILDELAARLARGMATGKALPTAAERLRLAALIREHVARPV